MCRMVLAVGDVDMDKVIDGVLAMARDINRVHELNEQQGQGSFTHHDGWGIAYLDHNNSWQIYKATTSIFESEELEQFRSLKTNVVLIHARKKMGSGVDINNTHPFHMAREDIGEYVFSHNGFIDEEIPHCPSFVPRGKTDSERIFYSILTQVNYEHTVATAVRKALNAHTKMSGSNIFMVSKEQSYVATCNNRYPRYYQMVLGQTEGMKIISSERLPSFSDLQWKHLEVGATFILKHQSLELEKHETATQQQVQQFQLGIGS